MRDDNVQPNNVTYTSLIDACIKDGQVQLAGPLLRRMINQGLKPDANWYKDVFEKITRQSGTALGAPGLSSGLSSGLRAGKFGESNNPEPQMKFAQRRRRTNREARGCQGRLGEAVV
eukprot:5862113-Pyramimonas_sp.AAC.1